MSFFFGTTGDAGASPPPPPPGPPVWLPQAPSGDYPVIYADMKNGHYWSNGAETTAGNLLIEDADDWGPFTLASITAGKGMNSSDGSDGQPIVNPTAVTGTILTAGYCAVVTCGSMSAITTGGANLSTWDLPDYNNGYQLDFEALAPNASVNVTSPADFGADGPVTTTATMKTACNVGFTNMVESLAGGTNLTVASASPGTPLTNIGLGAAFAADSGYMEAFAIYAPQPNTDLPTLSGA